MEKEIEKIRKERAEYLEGWKRAKADLANYKKEEEERMQALVEYAQEQLLVKIFPILDNLERAAKQIPEHQKENQICKGFFQIASQWKEFLKSRGIEEIEAVGKPFDPEMHEAVEEVDPPAGGEPGMVAEEVEKGYTLPNKLLRPAKVKVTK